MLKTFGGVEILETWLPIAGYEGLYEVSDLGNVRSLKRATTSGKVLSQKTTTSGYSAVCLCKNNEKKTVVVHRLVATAFISNPDNKPEVNHKNGIRTDNRIANLEWVTRSENELHAFRALGKAPQAYWAGKPRRFARKLSDEQVREIRQDVRSNSAIAAEYGLSKTAVSDIKRCKYYKEV